MVAPPFSAHRPEFWLSQQPDGSVLFEGAFEGVRILAAFVIHGNRCVILLDPDGWKEPTFENLLCVNSAAHLIWRAELPQTHDAYVRAEWCADKLRAWSWSGYKVQLDADTGRILADEFTK